jgi:hypothetical protein
MNWLVTVEKGKKQGEIDALLRSWGCERDAENPPIPIGEDEEVISVTGPCDLPQKAKGERRVRKVSPNSTMTLY